MQILSKFNKKLWEPSEIGPLNILRPYYQEWSFLEFHGLYKSAFSHDTYCAVSKQPDKVIRRYIHSVSICWQFLNNSQNDQKSPEWTPKWSNEHQNEPQNTSYRPRIWCWGEDVKVEGVTNITHIWQFNITDLTMLNTPLQRFSNFSVFKWTSHFRKSENV